jgi:hypothetical protein
LCLTMPRTVRQKIFDGALKWMGPWVGRTLHRFFRETGRMFCREGLFMKNYTEAKSLRCCSRLRSVQFRSS